MTSSSAQAALPQRLLAPDAARGVMLPLIAMAYAGAYAGAGFGVDASAEPAPDRAATFAAILLLDNRAFALFAILFGYGVAWSVARQESRRMAPADIRRTVRRRALLLLLFGAVHALLVFPGEILTAYGFALLVTGWLLHRSGRALNLALLVTGLFSLVTVPLLMTGAAVAPEDGFAQAVPGYTSLEDWIDRLVGVPLSPIYIAVAYPLLFLVLLGYRAGRARLFREPNGWHAQRRRSSGLSPPPTAVPQSLRLRRPQRTGHSRGRGFDYMHVHICGLTYIHVTAPLDPRAPLHQADERL